MSKLEYCSKCGDSDGPFCEHFYSPSTPSSANGAEGLPEPALRTDMHYEGRGRPAYSAEQLRAAVLAERNACIEICIAQNDSETQPTPLGCARIIRARK